MADKTEKKEADISGEDIEVCRAPGMDDWVYDYYNQQLTESGELEFEEHLFDCDRCQDVLLTLDLVYTQIRANSYRYAKAKSKAGKRRTAMETDSTNG